MQAFKTFKTCSDTFETESEYNEALLKLKMYESARKEWVIKDGQNPKGWTSITKEIAESLPYGKEVDNELRSKIEVWEWLNNPPDKYLLYIDENKKQAASFMSKLLGWVDFGKEYRDNFGGKRQSVSIRGTNGKHYYGIYYKSTGTFARIKAYKNQ